VNELLWYVSRATGSVAMVLMTAVLVLGLITSGRRRPTGSQATIVMAMHRWLSLGLVAFLGVHVVTAVVETYVDIGWLSALVPFTSGYAPWQVGLGTLAVDVLIAVMATSLLRHRISESAWRTVHVLSYAMWPLALLHGFVLGTSDQPLLRGVTMACGVVGLAAIGWRWTASHADRDRRRNVLAQEWS
jgi:sulfoxide reductase heme-binding subunit YedZ